MPKSKDYQRREMTSIECFPFSYNIVVTLYHDNSRIKLIYLNSFKIYCDHRKKTTSDCLGRKRDDAENRTVVTS